MKKGQNYGIFIFLSFLATLVFGVGVFVVVQSISIKEQTKDVIFKSSKKLTYEILTQGDKYYHKDILKEQDDYVAAAISKVLPVFDVQIDTNKKVDLEYTYKIDGTLLAKDNEKLVKTKKYNFIKKKTIKLEDVKNTKIHEEIAIDYDFYKEEIKKIKEETGRVLNSVLVVTLDVSGKASNNRVSESIKLEIPITNQTKKIKIKKEYSKPKNDNKSLVIKVNNNQLLGGILIIIGSFIVLVASLIIIKRRKEIKKIRKRISNLKTSNNVKR